MAVIGLTTNILAAQTQRRLARSTSQVEHSSQRLSSGLRINRASDDAAGLSIASGLEVDSRVYGQGVRNLNDAASLLNVAESALDELTAIVIRQRELAVQASNGVLSLTQRRALTQEANALGSEYNRIVQSTSFNGARILEHAQTARYSASYGETGAVQFTLGQEFDRTVGTGLFDTVEGTFAAPSTGVGRATSPIGVADVTSDGKVDLLMASGSDLWLYSGNGDGTFDGGQVVDSGTTWHAVATGDFNRDGLTDIAAVDDNVLRLFAQQPAGGFSLLMSEVVMDDTYKMAATDLNNDGITDIMLNGGSALMSLISRADGTFSLPQSYSVATQINDFQFCDYDSNGTVDVVAAIDSVGAALYSNSGAGTLTFAGSVSAGEGAQLVGAADLNNDGLIDLAISGQNSRGVTLRLGNGNGTFRADVTVVVNGALPDSSISFADVNNDGVVDFGYSTTGAGYAVHIGNGDGTFKPRGQNGVEGAAFGGEIHDVNGDNVLDVVTYYPSPGLVALARTEDVSTVPVLNLLTQVSARAAMSVLDSTQRRISAERGAIGGMQSRLSTALNNLQQSRENFESAASQIRDVDTAGETALLVRNRILQQAGAALLAQAQRAPKLALQLLDA